MTNQDMTIGLMKGIGILIEGCRGTEQGEAALKEWDKWRAAQCHGVWGIVPQGTTERSGEEPMKQNVKEVIENAINQEANWIRQTESDLRYTEIQLDELIERRRDIKNAIKQHKYNLESLQKHLEE